MDNSWPGLDRYNEVGTGRWRSLSRQTAHNVFWKEQEFQIDSSPLHKKCSVTLETRIGLGGARP